MLRIEVFSEDSNALGEGPSWDVAEHRLYWIDSYGPAVFSCDARGGDRKCWRLPEPVGSIALREMGGAIVSLRTGFHTLDVRTGEVRSRRVFNSFENQRGLPDGVTVDEEGYVWSCKVYSGRLIRFDPSGVVDRIVGHPVNSTTSLVFGGPNLDIAYVTLMARPHRNAYRKEAEAGAVFAIHGLGVRGVPEPHFKG